ncbi:hypothetical protein CAOG_06405 [Capsaspora owczarzaki ATCC 30864]|uniref:Uncharacterized protein n=1 Tax=Capsaspora owczarzaki (strain ATCC 30864) TaxID=595528 RepID=A0A0D2WV78_CAPO3|nr:hypothetical protein CAOG_06405 [Capsaspora owczarzaki ATCC 30864]KJE96033.1 hypothetical protein CAOG_006405 [Capsaspora owczarzaki ATCC 30864]|eukprot:XP_004345154.1 hypothetical protein CAOG_06405 [Capsaspora owczarzaki ATCC 30864]
MARIATCVLLVVALAALSKSAMAYDGAFAVFTDGACAGQMVEMQPTTNNVCVQSANLGNYLKLNIISSTQLTYSVNCNAGCAACATTNTANFGACVPITTGKWVKVNTLKHTSLTVNSYTSTGTCSSTGTNTVQTVNSGACVAQTGGSALFMQAVDLGNSKVWYNLYCGTACTACRGIGHTPSDTCSNINPGMSTSIHINSSASLTASVTLIGLAVAVLSAFSILA